MMDVVKILVGLGFYSSAILAGLFVLPRYRWLEDAVAITLILLLGLHIDRTIFMVQSIEWYRGATKGYEFSLMNTMALALIAAAIAKPGIRFRWLPLLSLLWLLYVGASSLSLLTAINRDYVLMSIFKFAKAWLLAIGIANYVRSEREIRILLLALTLLIIHQFYFVATMKWIDGIYQVRGLFEHQNPLSMFMYMAAFVLLATGLSPALDRKWSWCCLIGFAFASIIILAALSRAGLLFFAAGTVCIIAWGFFDRFTLRRVTATFAMLMGGAVLLAATLPTLIGRFHDDGNKASGETREVMNLAAKAMRDDKLFGIGWNNFAIAINHPFPYGDVIDDWNLDRGQNVDYDYAKGVVESHYWLIMAENGYPGILTYFLFILTVSLQAAWLMLRDRGTLTAACAAGIFFGFNITYVHSTLERVLTQTKNLGLWMVLIGLLAALWYMKPHPPRTDP